MRTNAPVPVSMPTHGVRAIESIHTRQFRMGAERHDFHELYFLFRGSLRYFEGNHPEPRYLTEGCLYLIPPGTLHRVEDQGEVTLLILAMNVDYTDRDGARAEVLRHLAARPSRAMRPDTSARARIERSFRAILVEQTRPRLGSDLAIQAEAASILLTLARLPDDCSESNSHTRVSAVLRELEETFFEEWDIDMAARRAHLSRRRFSMIVREITGESFIDLRNRLRLQHAALLLSEHRHTIAGAAFSSGFQDLAHFYRLFRRQYGAAPGRWKKGQGTEE